MEQCIVCGKPTENLFTLYRAREEESETQEVRSDYITEKTRRIRRVHQKIITRFSDISEVPFGYCKTCLYANRRKGVKLLAAGTTFVAAGIAVFFLTHGAGRLSAYDIIAGVTAFSGLLVCFAGLHLALASTKNIPYDTQKGRLMAAPDSSHGMRFFSPFEYEYFKKNGMAEIRHRTLDLPV